MGMHEEYARTMARMEEIDSMRVYCVVCGEDTGFYREDVEADPDDYTCRQCEEEDAD